MKYKLLSVFFLLCFFVTSCEEDPARLELSQTSFEVDGTSTKLNIEVVSDAAWTVSSNANWCTPTPKQGTNNAQVTLTLQANPNDNERTAMVVITAGKTTQEITITQGPAVDLNTYHYKLPVIFHVLYDNANDPNQYVKKGRLADMLAKCNQMYKTNTTSSTVDMNLEFVLATHDPDGNRLEEPGVERIKIANSTMDCLNFMRGLDANDKSTTTYTKMLWDPNDYINVFVYTFTETNVFGISHLPYTPIENPLEGLYKSNNLFTNKPAYPHSLSINNRHIYIESTSQKLYIADVVVTLSHELGHYLGLHHTFSEEEVVENGEEVTNLDSCLDTDYCADTKTYNSEEYNNWLANYDETTPDNERSLQALVTRKDCSGNNFYARNIMDYPWCLSDQFTNDQRTRIRHVLANSPIIPGPKASTRATRSIDNVVPPIIFKK